MLFPVFDPISQAFRFGAPPGAREKAPEMRDDIQTSFFTSFFDPPGKPKTKFALNVVFHAFPWTGVDCRMGRRSVVDSSPRVACRLRPLGVVRLRGPNPRDCVSIAGGVSYTGLA